MTGLESRSRQSSWSCASSPPSNSISMNLPIRTAFTEGIPWCWMASRTATPCGSSTLFLGITMTVAFMGAESGRRRARWQFFWTRTAAPKRSRLELDVDLDEVQDVVARDDADDLAVFGHRE